MSLSGSAGAQNYIDPNEIHSNGGLGADLLDDDTVLQNDPGDADSGANNRMNYPVMTSVVLSGTKLTVDATLDTIPNKFHNIFYFVNTECDPSGYGEGEKVLGSYGVNSGATGQTEFRRVFANPPLLGRGFITMAASDPESSSEFSLCVPVDITADYNCSSTTDAGDAASLLRGIVIENDLQIPSSCSTIGEFVGDTVFGDADCDDELTPKDPLVLLAALAGAEAPSLPVGCTILLTP